MVPPRPEVNIQFELEQTDSYATHSINMGIQTCMPELPAELCVMNLHARPGGTATLGDLNDCVETVRAVRHDGWVGHGCAPLLAQPTCQGVIVSPDCVVPIH